MLPHDALVAGVEADVLSAEGLFYVDGVYYATFGDSDLVRRRLAERTADTVLRTQAWTRRGAMVDGVPVRPIAGSAPTLFERCAWCGRRFAPGASALALAGRRLHEDTCLDQFDRFLVEAEIERAEATLRLVEA